MELQMHNNRPLLLVEDDEVDAKSVKRAMKDLNVTNPLYHKENGEEALRFLRDPKVEKPAIIILDINMPGMNGLEMLKILKHDEELKHIPVIILTTSRTEAERNEGFSTGAAGYMIKPVEYRQFVEVIRTINLYWTISELPE